MKRIIRHLTITSLGFVLLSCATSPPQQEPTSLSLRTFAERSAIVVRGTVVRTSASIEPLLKPTDNAALVKVSRMYAGSEIAGDQTGRTITVILNQPSQFKAGTSALFFGNPRFVGKSVTMLDEGEILSADAEQPEVDIKIGVQARRDKPVLQRLSTAAMVFRGKVESEEPLDVAMNGKGQKRELYSEHDPEWHIASVRVIIPLRGADKDALILVIYPASRDIMWFNSPKLEPGQDSIFITHNPAREEEALMGATGVEAFINKHPAVLVTQPFDVLPASDEARVRGLLAKEMQ